MIDGVICTQEIAKYSNNLLTEFCNFNRYHEWTKSAGGSNATIETLSLSRDVYAGVGAVSVNFTGTGQISFNAGGTQMRKSIVESGMHVLAYRFKKSDSLSSITFIVEMYVNGTLQPTNTITQDLYNSNGFVDDEYNTYFQNVYLENGDYIDFAFKVQSDTTDCNLYFDGLKLELSDRTNTSPTIYTEAPLDIIEEENTIDVGNIAAGAAVTVTAALTGARFSELDKHNVVMTYPVALITSGLIVGVPLVTADNVVKFIVYNPTVADINPTSGIFNLKIVR